MLLFKLRSWARSKVACDGLALTWLAGNVRELLTCAIVVVRVGNNRGRPLPVKTVKTLIVEGVLARWQEEGWGLLGEEQCWSALVDHTKKHRGKAERQHAPSISIGALVLSTDEANTAEPAVAEERVAKEGRAAKGSADGAGGVTYNVVLTTCSLPTASETQPLPLRLPTIWLSTQCRSRCPTG